MFGTYSAHPLGQRSRGRGERKPPLPPAYRKEERGFWGRDSSRPQSVVPVHINVCQPLHEPFGGGVGRNLKLGEGAEPPPAVRLRFGRGLCCWDLSKTLLNQKFMCKQVIRW